MKRGTWSLQRVLIVSIVGIVLTGMTACLPATPAPATRTPTCTPTLIPSHTPTPPHPHTPTLPHPHTPTLPHPHTPTPSHTPTLTPLPTATPVPSPDVALVRGPYLQAVTTNSIIVAWETDQPSHGEVAYGETGEYVSRVADPAMETHHAVTLTGLAPYTVYHYRVETGGAPMSEDAAFRTAAGPEQTDFTFVVFGDTRTQREAHQAVVERIVALDPDFVVHTGDLVEMGSALPHWEIFFEVERELMAHVPLFPAAGNHEGNHPRYFDLFYLPGNERWYEFDYGNARFVILQVDGIADFDPQSEQYAWLEETLAANTQPWLFVTFHIPPYSSLSEKPEEVKARETLTPLFEQYGVDLVFNGHHHNYQRSVVNGVTYIVTGGGGAPLYGIVRTDDYLLTYKNAYHVVYVTIAGDTLTSMGVTPEGEEFDRFTLALP